MYYRVYELPWSLGADEERRFWRILRNVAIGLAIVWLGIVWQRREAQWTAVLQPHLPRPLRELMAARAVS